MQHRSPTEQDGKWLAWVVDSSRALTVEIAPGTPWSWGDPPVSFRAVGTTRVAVSLGKTRARLNGVEVSGHASMRVGETLSLGSTSLLLFRGRSRSARGPPVWEGPHFHQRLVEEVRRAGQEGRSLTLLFLEGNWLRATAPAPPTVAGLSEGAVWGRLSPEFCQVICFADAKTSDLEGSARIGVARFPDDARDPDALAAHAWDDWLGEPDRAALETVLLDSAMVQLVAQLEHLAAQRRPLLLCGEAGVGKKLWARTVLASALGAEKTEVAFLEDVERATEASLAAMGKHDAALWGSTELPMESLAPRVRELWKSSIAWVPALRDRPSEIIPLAQSFLAAAKRRSGKSALALSAEAREGLLSYPWPGNVPELKNVVFRAAAQVPSGEIGVAHLGLGPPAPEGQSDFRGALKATEREVLLRVLQSNGWNVAEMARQLGLPRRTAVHRMARLGLKRPRA